MRSILSTSVQAVIATLIIPAMGLGQSLNASVSASGGTATDQRGVRSSAATLAPALTYTAGEAAGLSLGGSFTKFQAGGTAFGGNAGGAVRIPLAGSVALGASAAASAVATSYDARYSTAEAVSALEARLGALTIYGGARLAAGGTSAPAQLAAPTGPLGQPSGDAQRTEVSSTSAGPVAGAMLELAGSRPGQGVVLGYREERARIAQAAIVDRSGTLAMAAGPLSLSATAGWRDATDEHTAFASGSAMVALGSAGALQVAGGSYPSNRLSGTAGGSFLSLGVVLRTARRDEEAPAARPIRGAPAVSQGMTRLSLHAPTARRVELAGDWNDWAPAPATRGGDGTWYADVRLERGEHRYAFKVDGGRWEVPERVATVDDGFGGRSAMVSVR